MKSINELADVPAGVSLLADDIVEFHAARILLLIELCGITGRADGVTRIEGLTKLAKLDFFVRYPHLFDKACADGGEQVRSSSQSVESSMVRHHYGPWDHRYYDILAYLRSRGLIKITTKKNTYNYELTSVGKERAKQLSEQSSFRSLCEQMRRVKKVFGSQNGSSIKNKIYEIFKQEVAQKSLGDIIE
jgi:DNA-binding PadR family transcriptional regulator